MIYTVKLEREERLELKKVEHGKFQVILKVVNEIDPVGLGHLPDEYDIEVLDILANLQNCQNVEDVKNLVYEVFCKWFSSDLAEPILEENMSYFEEIYSLKK
jgi:hypothetical protein